MTNCADELMAIGASAKAYLDATRMWCTAAQDLVRVGSDYLEWMLDDVHYFLRLSCLSFLGGAIGHFLSGEAILYDETFTTLL